MMRKLLLMGIAGLTLAISSCDEETRTMGNTVTEPVDRFVVVTDTFPVVTRSIKTDSVLSTSVYSYLGRVKDPETGSYITSDYMTQFHILENSGTTLFPPKSYLHDFGDDGGIVADSCEIKIMINTYQGDSLTAMKLTMTELKTPVPENAQYYTDFDPEAEGYLRPASEGGICQNKVYSVSDLLLSDSLRGVYRSGKFYEYISIPVNGAYTDKNGVTYEGYSSAKKRGSGYGTYLMRMYYDHPEYFKNSLTFKRNVCPGFYFKTTNGLGLMVEVAYTQIVVYYHYTTTSGKVVNDSHVFNATEEVLQTTHITNDKSSIDRLWQDNTCTYLKTPSGLFTEIDFPIDAIKLNHEKDSITSAKISFLRMNSLNENSNIVLEEPTTLLLIERDSLYTYFEKRKVPDNISSYIATYNSTYKTYTFNNISSLISTMYSKRNKSPRWNKAILVPVQLEYIYSSSSSTVAGVANEMNINSVRLIGGTENAHEPVRISVIYNKNE